MPRTLTPRGQEILDGYPPFLRGVREIRAAADMTAQEMEALEAAALRIRDDAFPALTENAALYEAMLKIVNPPGRSAAQRRGKVLAAMLRVVSTGSGAEWEDNMTALFGGNWTYREYAPVGDRPLNAIRNPRGGVSNAFLGPSGTGTTPTITTSNLPAGWSTGFLWAETNHANTTVAFYNGPSGAGAHPVASNTKYSARTVIRLVSKALGNFTNLQAWAFFYKSDGSAATGSPIQIGGNVAAPAVGGDYEFTGVVTSPADAIAASIRPVAAIVNPSTFQATATGFALQKCYADGLVLPYFDGAMPGYEWTGSAHISTSRALSTAGAYIVDVFIPLDPASPQAMIAEALARSITPANVELNVSYSSGFILGASTLGDVL